VHNGQIFPFGLLSNFSIKDHGMYKLKDSYLYVSQVQNLGTPMRFLSNSEIVEIILKKKINSNNLKAEDLMLNMEVNDKVIIVTGASRNRTGDCETLSRLGGR